MKNQLRKYLLSPIAVLYASAVIARNKLFDRKILKSHSFDIPLISVGNITVGGTGKTPHVEYLIRILKDEFKVAVLSRGYKRKTSGFILAGANSTADDIGDEAMQIKNKFPGILVAVDESRSHGIKKLLTGTEKPDVVLLDDAFQHRYVKAGLSILLIDFTRPLHKDWMLPAGNLREPSSAVKRADMIIFTKIPDETGNSELADTSRRLHLKEDQELYYTRVIDGSPMNVFNSSIQWSDKDPVNSALLVSGIANPSGFRKFAGKYAGNIHEMIYPDHHHFHARDIAKIRAKYTSLDHHSSLILTTEKDAMRFRKFRTQLKDLEDKIFYIPIRIEFLHDLSDQFNQKIMNYVRSHT